VSRSHYGIGNLREIGGMEQSESWGWGKKFNLTVSVGKKKVYCLLWERASRERLSEGGRLKGLKYCRESKKEGGFLDQAEAR